MEDTNRCVCCGDIIPDGRMVCPACEKEPCQQIWLYDGIVRETRRTHFRYRCQRCGATRIDQDAKKRLDIWNGDGEYDE